MKFLSVPTLKRPTLPKITRQTSLLACELAGVVSVLVGVSAWSVPCAFILGGLTLIATIERQ